MVKPIKFVWKANTLCLQGEDKNTRGLLYVRHRNPPGAIIPPADKRDPYGARGRMLNVRGLLDADARYPDPQFLYYAVLVAGFKIKARKRWFKNNYVVTIRRPDIGNAYDTKFDIEPMELAPPIC